MSSVTSTFYDMKKREEELNNRIEQLEKMVEQGKDENVDLRGKMKEHSAQLEDCESMWRKKYDELVNRMDVELKREKDDNDVLRETISTLERKWKHLSEVNARYMAKLESLGIYIGDMEEMQLSAGETATREQRQTIFLEELTKVQHVLQSTQQSSEQQIELLSQTQSDLGELMREFNPQSVESDIGLHDSHLTMMKRKFAELRKGRRECGKLPICKPSKCQELLRPSPRPLEIDVDISEPEASNE